MKPSLHNKKMRSYPKLLGLLFLAALPGLAQQEFGVLVGVLSGPAPSHTGSLTLGNNVALEGNYGRVLKNLAHADLLFEVDGVVNPQRSVTSSNTAATKNLGSMFLTPGIRLRAYPKNHFQPWVAAGAGYALYWQSNQTIAGGTNPAPGHKNLMVVSFGGGADWKWSDQMMFRAEAREFVTGSPDFNMPTSGAEFNFVVSAGVVFHIGK